MSDDEKIKRIKSNLSEYALHELNLANFSSQEERRFHEYIKGICQRLLGDTLNLDTQNIIFALSDKAGVNAAHVSQGNISIIYLTEGLLNLCENEDQLAFILGHELGHYEERLRQGTKKINSKAEETACDLRAIQKMARGCYNLEEACNIAATLFNNHNIWIEDLKDPHTNDISRVNLINAMKKKEKDRIIEEQNIEITQSTPLPSDILEMVQNRIKRPSLDDILSLQMRSTENQSPDDAHEKKIALWFEAFYKSVISNGHSYGMTEDDSLALKYCLNDLLRNEKISDKFLATVFAEMESLKDNDNFATYVDIMQEILSKIYSYDEDFSRSKINADEKDCLTAMWLRRYLHGFREATDDRFDKMIQNLEYVKQFVAKHNFDDYRGILVKNFNLLELEFNENDIGKRFSPQILKYIRSHINAKDKFVTFDGLVAHPIGDSLILTHEKNKWSIFVDSSGEITLSFPAQNLAKMQIMLMKQVIENTQKKLGMVANGEITDFATRLKCLHEAHRIILPMSRQNDLKNILEIRNKTKDTKDILMSDVMAVLSPEAAQFFSERTAEAKDNLVYTNQITNFYADMIRTAPKEYYQEIFNALTLTRHISQRLSGEDKLIQAFFDNPVFFEELEKTIKSYEPFPERSEGWSGTELFQLPDSDTRCSLLNLLSRMEEITEFKLCEHLENGGNFDNFEQPFKSNLARLFSFAPQGDIDETLAIQHLKESRNIDERITLYGNAYIIYSSYDALKSNTDTSAELLMGFNTAGCNLKRQAYILNESIKRAQKDHIDDDEQHLMQERRQRFLAIADKIHHRLTERLQQAIESKKLFCYNIWNMVSKNDKIGNETYGSNGFETIISNMDFEKSILSTITQGDDDQIDWNISSLRYLIRYYESTKEQDIFKEKIWPAIATIFQRDDISLSKKVDFFSR